MKTFLLTVVAVTSILLGGVIGFAGFILYSAEGVNQRFHPTTEPTPDPTVEPIPELFSVFPNVRCQIIEE